MNADAKTGKPFFSHWMTVSNHRPFTYPDNKIDIPSDAKSREGDVKYTDYALKQFFKMAKNNLGLLTPFSSLYLTIVPLVLEKLNYH